MPRKLANLIVWLWMGAAVLARPRISAQALFERVWGRLHPNPAFRRLVGRIPGKGRQPSFNEHLYSLISRKLPSFYRSLELPVPAVLQDRMARPEPFVLLHFHDGFSFISKILVDRGRHFTRIVDDPESYLSALEAKFPGAACAHAVGADLRSLVQALKAVKQGDALCCAIDYKEKKQAPYSHVSPAMIEFANRNGLDVFFVKSNILDSGKAELLCWGPFNGIDAEACAGSFIDLYNSHGESRRKLTVKSPASAAPERRR